MTANNQNPHQKLEAFTTMERTSRGTEDRLEKLAREARHLARKARERVGPTCKPKSDKTLKDMMDTNNIVTNRENNKNGTERKGRDKDGETDLEKRQYVLRLVKRPTLLFQLNKPVQSHMCVLPAIRVFSFFFLEVVWNGRKPSLL